eukprot:6100988-Ditylum_brightwellii.AAC.1
MMVSATEAKLGVLYENVRNGEEHCVTLEEMGHLQLLAPTMTDIMTANGIVNDTVHWRHQDENLGDYHTRNHPVAHHKRMCK